MSNKINNKVQLIQETREMFSGPLPPPDILSKYDEIVPGAAERILKMAERQSEHRQFIEKKVIGSDILNSKLGLVFGFVISMAAILGSIYIIIKGHSIAGFVLMLSNIVALVSLFIYNSYRKNREIERKRKEER